MSGRIGRLIFRLVPLWSWRICIYGSLAALLLVGASILGLRYWILPNIDGYRGELEAALTRATGQRITIGEISADWQGLRPQFSMTNLTVYDSAGRPALELERIDNSLSWLSLLVLEPRFHTLQIHRPHLDIRRAADGSIAVAGIPLEQSKDKRGLADWLFRQREIVVTEASLAWNDELRQAPELRLSQATLRLQNDFFSHRLALNAQGPPELAGPIDVRADLVGRSVGDIAEWQGQIFAQLDYVDLAQWKPWLDMPVDIAQGRGAVRAWIDVAQRRATAVVADVRLNDLKARLAPDLEQLDLASLTGRIAWRGWPSGFEVSVRNLHGAAVAGHGFETDDFTLRRTHDEPKKPGRTEIRASALDLDALSHLLEHLPIEAVLREELRRYAPRGRLHELSGGWTGPWASGQYHVKTRFEDLALNAVDRLPGWRGLTGSVDASDKGGLLTLASRGMSIDLPRVFAERLELAEAAGQVRWTAPKPRMELRLSEFRFANADMAGTMGGSYRSVPGEPGYIDIAGALTRADATRVARYLPLMIGRETRDWVRTAVLAGQSNDVKLRLKGNLAEFPFQRRGTGAFQVTAKARGVALQYAEGWPRFDNIAAELAFSGARMDIRGASGVIMGARITAVQAFIPDLLSFDELLELTGEAEGPTAEFTRFITASPVADMIDRSTDGMEPQGSGRLALRMTLPLRRIKDTRVAGSYLLHSNRLRVHPELPPLEQVSGRVEFTDSSVRGQGITAQLLGGPAVIGLATQDGSVVATAGGRASIDALRRSFDLAWLKDLGGSADWRGTIRLRARQTDFTVESDLRGVVSNLPVPLAKAAADALALRIERKVLSGERDQIDVGLGSVLNARLIRRRDGERMTVDRGGIGLGMTAPAADASGLWLRGTLPSLDLDRWRALAATGMLGGTLPPVASAEVKLGSLDVLGRRFQELAVSARQQGINWEARVSGRELAGDIEWRPQGKGQLIARLQRLSLTPPVERVAQPSAESVHDPVEYPALDVVVEEFQHNGRALGRLQMQAVSRARNWQIDQLQIGNPEGTLTADGSWQWQAQMPRTLMNFSLQVSDIGRFLARMGYPEGVKGGTATLGGTLSWSGAPHDLDMPSLAGHMNLEAARGQFAKLEPGIGKLLSILSLQALPRRVALDFKDVFSEGFAFDTITGMVRVQGGIASTESFRINGSSARVTMSGEVDLARETQKLRVRVVPSIGDSVATVTALLGGPVAGIGVFLAQRLLNDPLGQLIAYDYSVTGTWVDPAVVKLGADRAEPG